MPTHDPDGLAPDLAPFVRDAAGRLDGLVTQARPVPDFAAMLARARELDPATVAAEAVAEAEALPPVIPLAPRRSDAAALDPFTAALRAELDGKLAERRMASIPAPPLPRRRRAGVIVGIAVALAAAVLLAVVGPDLVARQAGERGVAAALEGGGGPLGEARAGSTSETHVDAVEAPPVPVEPVLEDMPEAPVVELTAAPSQVPPDPSPRKSVSKDSSRRRSPPVTPVPAGPSLEDEAQLLWQKGELAAAERKYREIVDLQGADPRAELAYGDLFALVRQLRGAEGQAGVWREYLLRFPAGRFAEDARAGLCRRGPSEDRAACWREYLDHHPTGAHRKQAEVEASVAEAP